MLRPLDYGVEVHFSQRKWRLFALACVRRVCHVFRDERTRELVEAVERSAEGLLSGDQFDRLWREAKEPANLDMEAHRNAATREEPSACAWQALATIPRGWFEAARAGSSAVWARAATGEPAAKQRIQVSLLRDVFGNPFRQSWLEADWLTSTVKTLAQTAYEQRSLPGGELEPAHLAVLADALEEAGCADAAVLEHLRSPGPHVRGCWVLDLLTGRE
jgi:hypothetical protein